MELRGEAARWALEMATRSRRMCQRIETKRSVVCVPEGTETVSPPDTRSYPPSVRTPFKAGSERLVVPKLPFWDVTPCPQPVAPPASSATTTVLVPRFRLASQTYVQNDCLSTHCPHFGGQDRSRASHFRGSICAQCSNSPLAESSPHADLPQPSFTSVRFHHLYVGYPPDERSRRAAGAD